MLGRKLSRELTEKHLDNEMYMAYNMLGHINSICGNRLAAKRNFSTVIDLMKKGGYYESKAELIKAFNEHARESYTNIGSSWDVSGRFESDEYDGEFIAYQAPFSWEDHKVETTTVAEGTEKLKKYKAEYDDSCLGFPSFSYNTMQVMIYYLEGDKLMYMNYDSTRMGF